MAIDRELAALVRRLSGGEKLSLDDSARLNSLIASRTRGRPPRDDLKLFRDEFGRAVAFFVARTQMGDVAAVENAADVACTSERRVRGAVTWLRKVSGFKSNEFVNALRTDSDVAQRIAAKGVDDLTPNQILLMGSVNAFVEQWKTMLSPEQQAALLVRHIEAFYAALSAVVDVTKAAYQELPTPGGVTNDTGSLDLMLWVDAVASIEGETQVQQLADLLH